ncbi:MAG: hypothetical protein GTN76_15865 [Candidatus Aenigmarchaeota archaeon]|nr:hypothetical protein [Candidatus Aenigmarchaeota archaeon]
MKKIILFIALVVLLNISLVSAQNYCTYCGEKEYTFTKTGLDLGTSNTLKIVGHDTHGVTYISISCDIEDANPPVTTISPNGRSWTNTNVGFTLTCTDADSGCKTTYYKVINHDASCGTTGFSTGTSGTVTCPSGQTCRKRVCYYSEDNAGNVETTKKSNIFNIDKTEPFTSISLSGTMGSGGFYRSDVDVTLSCSDTGSGCDSTDYCIDTSNTCSPANSYSSPFTVSYEGTSYVRYRSTDNAGNEESPVKSRQIKIDKTAPTTSISPNGRSWTNTNVDFTLTCYDPNSGCDSTYYKVIDDDGACGTTGFSTGTSGSVTCTSGQTCRKRACYYSDDKAGNEESIKISNTFHIDKQIPTVAVTGNPQNWYNVDVDAFVACSDLGSGCNSNSYKLKIYSSNPGSCPTDYNSYDKPSPYTISQYSWVCGTGKDMVEHVGFSNPIEFKIDKNPPTPAILNPATSVTKSSVGLEWNENNDMDFSHYEVHYSETQNFIPVEDTLATTIYDSYDTSHEVKDLQEDTTYYFKIVTVDLTGLSSRSNEISETTYVCALGDTKPCGSNIGECSNGTRTCDANGEWGECIGYVGPSNESCNGKDDDCDAVIDNVGGGSSILETKCQCFDENAYPGEIEEICNGMDDDCNEQIDDGIDCSCIDGQKKPCGSNIGECSNGTATCIGGEWGECIGYVGPINETCNRKDDDCDSIIDNIAGGISVGETKCQCFNGSFPINETCNWIDDDCNEQIDDDLDCNCTEGDKKPCGSNVGECSNGTNTCIGGRWGECVGYVAPVNEKCNGKDDDCDGVIDNINEKTSVETTKCACYNGESQPGDISETCNSIDDDCDEEIDDGVNCGCIENEKKSCGSDIGECQSGDRTCTNGEWGACIGSVGPGSETCNGKDDDCDGTVDNVYGKSSIEATKCACYNRFSYPGTKQESCNQIDDDCDGIVDEGCPMGGTPGYTCENRIQDGDEEGIDCGGSCPDLCPEPPVVPEWTWLLVFLTLVIAIAGVWLVMVFFEKGKK